ncbi:hypothetical protein BER93_13390 [Xanthomonas fragariae]|nr:hypothetical protein BER92_13360 [Xanthomonas fragariae]AOD18929.1 hypothetical protein BER93_13390 [Xanthomonas fragariae]ENZ97159.1 hypothetical protein O1K_00455 [Xanthomonas fragariae LMG 25863]
MPRAIDASEMVRRRQWGAAVNVLGADITVPARPRYRRVAAPMGRGMPRWQLGICALALTPASIAAGVWADVKV